MIFLVDVDCWYKPAPGAASKAGTLEKRQFIVEADDHPHAREVALRAAQGSSSCEALLAGVDWRRTTHLDLPVELLVPVTKATSFRALKPHAQGDSK